MSDTDYSFGSRVRARFKPKNLDTLRGCMFQLIGRVFDWDWAGIGDAGNYKGQHWWIPDRRHDYEMPEDCRARWSPHEDLEIIEDLPLRDPEPRKAEQVPHERAES